MIQHVWERVSRATKLAKAIVATDDERIRTAVQAFGGEAIMPRTDYRSGTDRASEVAAAAHANNLLTVQGDEPLVAPEAVDALVEAIPEDESVQLATLAVPLQNPKEIMDPNIVKEIGR